MKYDVVPSIVRMEADDLKTLLTEGKETVAKGYSLTKQPKKAFGPADLWNIRRNAKTASRLMRR